MILAACVLLGAGTAPGVNPSEPPVLATGRQVLATYFLDNGQDGVYLAASTDGLRFEPLLTPNVPILKPEVGTEKLTRDACICLGPDGIWHMSWTTGWWEKGFGVAHSRDLVHWSAQRYVPAMADTPGTLNCWAPEIVFNPARAEYLLLWSSTVLGAFPETEAGGDPGPDGQKCNHRIYFSSTRDFITFTPARLYYNPGFNCIDATLLPPEGAGPWHLFLKDETRNPPSKNIRHLVLADPREPQGDPSRPITGDYWAEGPTAIRLATPDGPLLRVYFDRYADNRFGAIESRDGRQWSDISDRVAFPKDARHSTVVEVDGALVDSVRKALSARPE